MAKKKKSAIDQNIRSAEEAGREFGISLKDLETLMQTRGHEGIEQLKDVYGGLSGLEQKLKTNLINGKKKNVFPFSEIDFFLSFRFIRR
jgi:hypothetical protein